MADFDLGRFLRLTITVMYPVTPAIAVPAIAYAGSSLLGYFDVSDTPLFSKCLVKYPKILALQQTSLSNYIQFKGEVLWSADEVAF